MLRNVVRFLETAGVDFNDLPVASPLSHAALKALQHWYNIQRDQLDKGPKAADLLPNMVVDNFVHSGPAIHKYKVLLELDNTPFQHGTNAAALRGVRRLWNYLVRQDDCQEYFIKYIFSPPKRLPLMVIRQLRKKCYISSQTACGFHGVSSISTANTYPS